MSSLYEEELKRLIEERKSRISLLKVNADSKEIGRLKGDIEVLEADLKSFQKAMERFRAKPAQPSEEAPAAGS